eukprot:TRINITY_DN2659_c0_g1_i4.p1 TRINITY_DN2659_c0_g1~~TRINITY_DN2659_c0_g1_i4.p1  ORF type:complete len:294 (+),score=21.95 TRINITY_DN2659_c0_g1_i4:63-944(+)
MLVPVAFDGGIVRLRDAAAISLMYACRCSSSLAAIRGTKSKLQWRLGDFPGPRSGRAWKTHKSCLGRSAILECQAIRTQHSDPEFEACSRSFLGMIIERALQAYLRMQLEKCGELKILVEGNNQELISGHVAGVRVFAKGAVYKGFALTAVDLQSSPLKFQFGKNKPLLHPFNVDASISIREEDLNFSLSSVVLSSAVADVLPLDWTSGQRFPKLAVHDGYLQVQHRQPEHSMSLCLELEDGGRSIQVCSMKGGSGKSEKFVDKRFDMTGVRIKQLNIVKDLISVYGNFTVTP